MRAAIYGRVSTFDQNVENHLDELHRYIRKHQGMGRTNEHQLGGGIVARLQIASAATPVPPPEDLPPAYPIRARHHIELSYAGRRVHIEAIAQGLGGPSGTSEEVRVHVDGVLEGRSIRLGRLGGTVNTFPVIARVDGETVMTVTPVRWTSFEELVVQLWGIRTPPRRRGGSSLVDDEVSEERR